jgi:hypothetical protein
MAEIHEGGCLCGAVRYRARNKPLRTSACHCTFCQRRTGSAFGVGAYFKQEDVELSRGALTTYEHRSDETQRWLRIQFCPQCGTTVTWTVEAVPGMRALALGTFDDPKWLKVERFGWFRSAHPWVIAPAGVEVFEKSALR